MQFSDTDAQIIIGFITSLVVPFVVSYIKNPYWPNWSKLAVALTTCLIAGGLTVYTTQGFDPARIAVALVAIFAAAHTWYKTWFIGLGLEDILAPKGPLVDEQTAKEYRAKVYPAKTEDYLGTP